jgi:hypothetical protein
MNFIGNNPNMNLTQHQLDMTSQINQMLAQSSDALMCGPDCQTAKKSDGLKQLFLDAATNVETAPIKLNEAKKNYIVYTQGNAAYNTEYETLEGEKAANLSKEMLKQFDNATTSTSSLIDVYSSLHSNYQNINDLYNKYVKENTVLEKKINNKGTDIITNDRKTYYEMQGINALNAWYSPLNWLYIILVVVFGIAIFLTNSTYSLKVKVGILFLLILYPFIINNVVVYIYNAIKNFFKLLPKNIYN